MRIFRSFAVVVAAGALAVAGCSSGNGSGSSSSPSQSAAALSGSITVYAAASLTEAFSMLGTQFQAAHPGTTVRFNFDASSTLATQIDQGAPADVFASAAPGNMTTVVQAGNAAVPTVFVTNRAEIATPPGNPKHIASVADLAKSGVKVALCDATVPCGVVAASVLSKAGVSLTPASREENVKAALAKVEINEVDAAIVYVTDVKAAGSKVVGVPIPDALSASTQYPIAPLTHSRNGALAKAFVAYVLSPAGVAVLTAAGFAAA
jgi:molybdate transport system substrate-binding protein